MKCKTCGQTITSDNIPIDPTAHDWGEWVVTTASTCTVKGEETRTCKHNDSHTETRDINPLGHDWQWVDTATVTQNGTERLTCSVCKETQGSSRPTYATGTPGLSLNLINNGTAYSVSRGTASGAVVIPVYHRPDAQSGYLPVMAIAFQNQSGITSVTFTAGSQLTTIGGDAFSGCSDLASITIPASVTSIGENAFSGTKIHNDTTNSVVYAGNWVVGVRGALSDSISLTAGTVGIADWSFSSTNITSITIPASVKFIGNSAFNYCNSLTSITFGVNSQLETIGSSAFSYAGITSIEIPASVKTIGEMAFLNCNNLETVIFAAGSQIEVIDRATFTFTSITNIIIPASVKTIGYGVFTGCASLKSVIFASGSQLEDIGSFAFNSTGITSIVIPASVNTIDRVAFQNCTYLERVFYGGNEAAWNSITISNDGNAPLTNATRYYYSATTPTTAGNFWQWVGGVPTIW